jgi:hypothetical protein
MPMVVYCSQRPVVTAKCDGRRIKSIRGRGGNGPGPGSSGAEQNLGLATPNDSRRLGLACRAGEPQFFQSSGNAGI